MPPLWGDVVFLANWYLAVFSLCSCSTEPTPSDFSIDRPFSALWHDRCRHSHSVDVVLRNRPSAPHDASSARPGLILCCKNVLHQAVDVFIFRRLGWAFLIEIELLLEPTLRCHLTELQCFAFICQHWGMRLGFVCVRAWFKGIIASTHPREEGSCWGVSYLYQLHVLHCIFDALIVWRDGEVTSIL